MTTSRIAVVTIAFLLLLAGLTEAAEGELRLETQKVVVFKDGYGLVVKKAVGLSTAAGEVYTEEVPDAAVLGSFWAVPSEGRLISMKAGVEGPREGAKDPLRRRVLSSSEGRKATVVLAGGSAFTGTIGRTEGGTFALETEDRRLLLPVDDVASVTSGDSMVSFAPRPAAAGPRKRLTFRFEGGAARRELTLLYFRPGIRWIPSYRMELDGDRARLRMQAEILNEAEDLTETAFDLVVGVPNFRFKEVVSPFVLERALVHSLRQAAPQLMGQQRLASNFANRAGEYRGPRPGPGAGAGRLDLPEELGADRAQDLFVYSLPSLSLKKGQRAAVSVFEAEVPVRHVYTWELHLTRKDIEAAPSGSGTSPLQFSANRIWHQVELTNPTEVPWTTGPALILERGLPLAQELVTYTSAGGTVRVPVTVAIDLRGDYSEEETDRRLDALNWLGYKYAKIDKRGHVSVRNHRDRPVELEIRCRLGGRAAEATEGGEIVLGAFEREDWRDYQGHPAVNNSSVITWKTKIGAKETFAADVIFSYFTRH